MTYELPQVFALHVQGASFHSILSKAPAVCHNWWVVGCMGSTVLLDKTLKHVDGDCS
jgi:hypothetical protein